MTTDASGAEPAFVVAGSIAQRTGGYLYDARIVNGLRELGRNVRVVELPGHWPDPDVHAIEAFATRLAGLPDGTAVVVDGLVGGAAPGPIEAERDRLRVIALVHHPLCDEHGVDDGPAAARARRLAALEGRTLEAARGVIVTSRFTEERVRELGADPSRVRVVEPGTARAQAEPDRAPDARLDPSGAPDPDPVRLLCLGAVVPRKDPATLMQALERVHAADPGLSWACSVVGSLDRDPPYASALMEAVASSDIGHRVEFTGEVDDGRLARIWGRSDVFVSASRYEGYGMALTEAMSRGLPVVAVAGGAVASTVPPDVGRLVPVADLPALSDALRRVLGDPALRRAMAARSAAHARSLPAWSDQAAAFDAALRDLVDV